MRKWQGALLAAALGVVAGCSQVDALAPVGGNRLTEVRFAVGDVLVQHEVQILRAPVCAMTGRDVNCEGTTLDGAAIIAKSSAADEKSLIVMIGDELLFSGTIQEVLDSAARSTS